MSVAAPATGDLQGCSDIDRTYTALFSGTSSASPVVAGAAVVLQGAWKAKHHSPLTPAEMRALLVETGTSQTSSRWRPAKQHIGPLPDVARALDATGLLRR